MIEDGLLERFPFEEIYGLHNLPGLPLGRFETRPGPVMSAEDIFEITLTGTGGHAARPEHTREVMVAACATVIALQTIVARRIAPTDIAVVSATEITTDGTRNVLPGTARILGDCRSFRPEVSAEIERQMRIVAEGSAATYNCAAELAYRREFVPLVNDAACTEEALAVASDLFGADAVGRDRPPITASEDFARFLARVPGCFGFIGNGEGSAPLHNPSYDFNDAALSQGAGWFVAMAARRLPG
jgi:hippurate hydrolase